MDKEEIERLNELTRLRDDDTYEWTKEDEEEYYYLFFMAQDETERDLVEEMHW